MDSTKFQDCNVIADAFERGAHFGTDEASVFAPMTRRIQNMKFAAQSSKKVISNYQTQPTQSIHTGTQQSAIDGQTGVTVNNQYVTIPSDQKSADVLSRAIKDCIPCSFRPLLSMDLNVSKNIIDAFKADIAARFKTLDAIKDLLTNLNFYGDYCQMMSFLNFMCVPDLQRIVMLLASMLTDYGSGLGKLHGLLQALIAPFFLPVLLSINSMMDKLVQLVLNPINCVITALQENIRKLDVGALLGDNTLATKSKDLNNVRNSANTNVLQLETGVKFALVELNTKLNAGNTLLRGKLEFYTRQLDKLLKQWSGHDIKYLSTASDKLIVIRLIAFVRAMIKARNGSNVCSSTKPSINELDHFFTKFLSPTSPFNITVDKDGNLRLEEKINTKPITGIEVSSSNLLKLPSTPISQTFKCQMNTSVEDIDKVNKWMSELDGVVT